MQGAYQLQRLALFIEGQIQKLYPTCSSHCWSSE
jgi:hypothetical protein